MKKFKISENQGYAYSIESRDKNKIHLDNLIGYNSIFNHKIVYGTLIFYKVLKQFNYKKLNQYSIKIEFIKAFKYDVPIKFNTKTIFQKNFGLARINFLKKNLFEFENKKLKLVKIFKLKNFDSNKKIRVLLNYLSWYVGMVNPGKYSLINSINLVYNSHNLKSESLKIYSKKHSRFPIIHNRIEFDKFIVEFKTLERPHLKKTNTKISKQVKNYGLNTKIPVLILGASAGIGKEIFDIFKINKNIKIIASYNNNKITSNKKNIDIHRIDIKNILKEIKSILNRFNNLRIYYFISPKILLTENNTSKIIEYKKFFIDIPNKIISLVPKSLNIEFFYPSTVFIDEKRNDDYTKSKIIAEQTLKKLNRKNIKVNILRIDKINTKQNLDLLNTKKPSFIEKLNINKHYQKKIFFLKNKNIN